MKCLICYNTTEGIKKIVVIESKLPTPTKSLRHDVFIEEKSRVGRIKKLKELFRFPIILIMCVYYTLKRYKLRLKLREEFVE